MFRSWKVPSSEPLSIDTVGGLALAATETPIVSAPTMTEMAMARRDTSVPFSRVSQADEEPPKTVGRGCCGQVVRGRVPAELLRAVHRPIEREDVRARSQVVLGSVLEEKRRVDRRPRPPHGIHGCERRHVVAELRAERRADDLRETGEVPATRLQRERGDPVVDARE